MQEKHKPTKSASDSLIFIIKISPNKQITFLKLINLKYKGQSKSVTQFWKLSVTVKPSEITIRQDLENIFQSQFQQMISKSSMLTSTITCFKSQESFPDQKINKTFIFFMSSYQNFLFKTNLSIIWLTKKIKWWVFNTSIT
mgnify:CR=1 FL=1